MPLNHSTGRDEPDGIVSMGSRLSAVPSPSGEERAVMESVVAWCA